MNKINVIYYNSTLLKGGTDTYMLEIIKNIDKSKFQVDVLIKDGDNFDQTMYDKLINSGSHIFLAKGSFLKRMIFLRKFFKTNKNKYSVCHINATSQGTGIISYFAHKNGNIKKIIFHSHMGGNDNQKSIIDKIGTKLMLKHSSIFASCSSEASKFMFEDKANKVLILNNSVDTKKFNFEIKTRNRIRKELNLSNSTIVFLHVGRFAPQKNHKRLIEIFYEYYKSNSDSKLILIGDGILLDDCKKQVEELNMTENILFLGLKNNVNEYMQAADCFLMPSVHEGLPIVAVEAQSTGLKCLLSSNISKETKLTNNVEFIDNNDTNKWIEYMQTLNTSARHSQESIFKEKNFDKESAIKRIEEIYSN